MRRETAVRRASISVAASRGVDTAITAEALAAAAKHPQASVRYAAAMAAARAQKQEALAAPLLAFLPDADAETRAAALRALTKHGAAGERFLPTLTDSDWKVRVESVRGALAKGPDAKAGKTDPKAPKPEPNKTVAAVASALNRAWLDFNPKKPGDAHVLLVGLEAAFAWAKEPAIRSLNDVIYAQSLTASDVDARRMGCLAAFARLQVGAGTLPQLFACADADLGAQLSARAIEEGLGGADRQAILTKLWKHPDERVRAAAAAAAVFAKILPQIIDQALAAKETSLVAFVADAVARFVKEKKGTATPAWLAKAVKRLEEPTLEVDAKLSLLEAVTNAAYKPALNVCRVLMSTPRAACSTSC